MIYGKNRLEKLLKQWSEKQESYCAVELFKKVHARNKSLKFFTQKPNPAVSDKVQKQRSTQFYELANQDSRNPPPVPDCKKPQQPHSIYFHAEFAQLIHRIEIKRNKI